MDKNLEEYTKNRPCDKCSKLESCVEYNECKKMKEYMKGRLELEVALCMIKFKNQN